MESNTPFPASMDSISEMFIHGHPSAVLVLLKKAETQWLQQEDILYLVVHRTWYVAH